MNKVRVLVADKQTLFRQGVCALLKANENIEVVGEATDGKDIIEKVREQTPDVLLMNAAMPVMDGTEVTHKLRRENGNIGDIKVLLLTEYEDRDHILSGFRAGANGYIPKRAAVSDLVSAIQAVYQGGCFLYPSVARMIVDEYCRRIRQPASPDPYERLTRRERQVLKLTAEGHKSKEIANLLGITVKTLLGHRTSVMKKLGIHNRTELVKYAIRKHLVDLEYEAG
jgi:two-component system response regulator NreC